MRNNMHRYLEYAIASNIVFTLALLANLTDNQAYLAGASANFIYQACRHGLNSVHNPRLNIQGRDVPSVEFIAQAATMTVAMMLTDAIKNLLIRSGTDKIFALCASSNFVTALYGLLCYATRDTAANQAPGLQLRR